MNLIKQMMLEQRLAEETVTVDDQPLAFLLLELGGLGGNVTMDDGRVSPISLLQGGREHILAHRVQSFGIGVRSCRPDGCENLVGPSAQEHRVARPKTFE